MSRVGKTFRFFIYPLAKPVESARLSIAGLKQQLDDGKAARQAQRDAMARRASEFAADAQDLTSEQLLNPRLIRDPARRFAVLHDLHQWDEIGFMQQRFAFRRYRRAALLAAAIVVAPAMMTLILAPVWAALVLLPAFFAVTVLALVQCFKYALFEWQFEVRALHGPREFMSQVDVFRRLLVW